MKRIAPLVVLTLALVLLTGCSLWGGDGSRGSDADVPGDSSDATRDPDRQGPAVPVEGATVGGTVTVLLPGDSGPRTLDPTAGWSVVGNSILQSLTHRSLTQYVRGARGQAVLVPDLATDLGTPNADFTQWRFTIREGATWENGEPVTPEQVAFGITRSFDDVHFPQGPGTQYTRTYFAGAEGYRGPHVDPGRDFDGVRVEDRDVVIDMARPFPEMDHWGAFMAMGPTPTGDDADPSVYGTKPLATGPYRVAEFVPGSSLTLVRNDRWRADSDPGRHQYVDRWEFRFDADQSSADDVLLAGGKAARTTIVHRLSPARHEEATRVLGEGLVRQQQPCLSMLAPDTTKVTDARVRRALALAVDHEAVWAASGEVAGVTRTRTDLVQVPGVQSVGSAGEAPGFDPRRARRLLAEAGYAPGEYALTLAHDARDSVAVTAQRALVRGLREAGFDARTVGVRRPVHEVYAQRGKGVDARLNVRHLNWCADWPSAATLLPMVLGSGEAYNLSHFSDASVDAEMLRIPTLPLADQQAAWTALAEKNRDELAVVVPTSAHSTLIGFGARIGNPTGEAATGAVNYKDLFVVR